MSARVSLAPEQFDGTVDRVVEMRSRGHPVSYIAAVVGISEAAVRRVLETEVRDRYRHRDDLIAGAALTLEWVQRQFDAEFHRATGAVDRRKALEGVLRCVEAKRKLFGLDAPTRIETRAVDDATDEELIAEARRHGIAVDPAALGLPPGPPAPAPEPS